MTKQVDLRHGKILVVEDQLPDVVLIKRFFAEQKISNDIRYARSISEAEEVLRQHAIDVCFVDVHLSDGSGFDLVRTLDTSRTTIVMLSATENIENLLEAQGLGAVAYVGKPLTRAMLDRLIQELKHLHWSIVVAAS